jgi:hypothetical protein
MYLGMWLVITTFKTKTRSTGHISFRGLVLTASATERAETTLGHFNPILSD